MLDITNITGLRNNFEEKGFCIIKNVFSSSDIKELLKHSYDMKSPYDHFV